MTTPEGPSSRDWADFTPEKLAQYQEKNDSKAREVLRALSRRSFFFYCKALTSYGHPQNLMQKDVFKDRALWIARIFTDGKRGLLEDPRGHLKTWGASIPGPCWLACLVPNEELDHPSEVERAREFLRERPHLQGPDSRYLIISESTTIATRWVAAGLAQWDTNPILRWGFPEFLWANQTERGSASWSKDGFTLKGRQNPRLPDPFLRPAGLNKTETGGRADGLFIDDLVSDKSWNSASEMEKRRTFVRTITFLLTNPNRTDPRGGFVLMIGNRWTFNDVNSLVHDELQDWEVWRRADRRCLTHGVGNCGRWGSDEERTCVWANEPLWTEMYPTMDSLAQIEKDAGPEIYAAQRLNDPMVASVLDERKFVPFTLDRTIVLDPGTGERHRAWALLVDAGAAREVIPLASLSQHLISIDPASSEDPRSANTAVSWFAFHRPSQRRFWLDCRGGHWAPDRAIEEIWRCCSDATEALGTCPQVLCEKVGAQGYVASALANYNATQGRSRLRLPEVTMVPVKRGQTKQDRQRDRVGYLLGKSLLYLRSGLVLPRAEARRWPATKGDALDTLVQAESIYQQSRGTVDSERLAARRANRRRALRSFIGPTGVPIS